MDKKNTILIHNIYYMLSYAFQELGKNNYDNVNSEEFEHALDLFAEILYRGIAEQLKRGLYKEYIEKHETLSVLRGRVEINGTIRNIIQNKRKLNCKYDELSVNNLFNRVLKSTMLLLIRRSDVNKKRKNQLHSILPFFSDIDEINLYSVNWSTLSFQRNNGNYRMLMNICYFIVDGMLISSDGGNLHMPAFSEEHMNRLFERFVLNYYKKHYPKLKPNADLIKWNISLCGESEGIDLLPTMHSDITLHGVDCTLVVDAKYYSKIMQSNYGKKSIYSQNLYQIFTYVKNVDCDHKGDAVGLLLYAKTTEEIIPKLDVIIDGNRILVRVLDLNQKFDKISRQLDDIVKDVVCC